MSKRRDICGCALLLLYLLCVGFVTGPSLHQLLVGRLPGVRLELIPLADIIRIATDRNSAGLGALANIAGNVILFMPLGLLLPLFWRSFLRARNTVLCGLLLSLSIELIQMVAGGVTSVDDLLLNTLGAYVGWLCAALLLYLLPRLTPQAESHAPWRWPLLCWALTIVCYTALDFIWL